MIARATSATSIGARGRVASLLCALACVSALAGCAEPPEPDEPIPRCADVGCPLAPSGDPVAWEPCDPDAASCWCGAPDPVECRP